MLLTPGLNGIKLFFYVTEKARQFLHVEGFQPSLTIPDKIMTYYCICRLLVSTFNSRLGRNYSEGTNTLVYLLRASVITKMFYAIDPCFQ